MTNLLTAFELLLQAGKLQEAKKMLGELARRDLTPKEKAGIRGAGATVAFVMWSLLVMAVSGCSLLQAQPDRSRFYLLAPVQEAATDNPATPLASLTIGLGPIRFPDYLQRTEIVRRIGENRLQFSELDRWAEPLEANFARVLSRSLRLLLHTDEIAIHPWIVSFQADYQVPVEVLRFELEADGAAHLVARWVLKDRSGKKLLRAKESNFAVPASARGTDAAVAALSATVGDLGREIAGAIREVDRQRAAANQ
jgi:uncharacterized lipoprotein YmbA